MHTFILIVNAVVALLLIVLVLLQQGKGADAGASFGSGSSQTVFGSQGADNFLTRATAVLAAVFFVTSFGLAWTAKREHAPAVPNFGATTQEVPATVPASDAAVPVVPVPVAPQNPDVPVTK